MKEIQQSGWALAEMSESFTYDVFLSHSFKDKAVVRELAERLRKDRLNVWFDEWVLKPGDSIPAKIEEGLERSRLLVLCMSANALGSDWAQLEYQTFRFRDPLNKERRFIPMRLDDSPIKGSLAQFLYIKWTPGNYEQGYARLFDACRPSPKQNVPETQVGREQLSEKSTQFECGSLNMAYAFSSSGKRVLSGSDDNTIRLWEVETGRCLRILSGSSHRACSVAWSANEALALSGHGNGTVCLWDVKASDCRHVLLRHRGEVWSVAFSPDQRLALSGASDEAVLIWDIAAGSCKRALEGHKGTVWSVAWNADQRYAFSSSADRTVRIWDVGTGRCIRVLEGHEDSVFCLALSPNGRYIVSGSHDRSVRLWEIESGRCLGVMIGHEDTVWSVAWSPDQRHVLSGSHDRSVRLWDVESWRCQLVLTGHSNFVKKIAWSGDNGRWYSADQGGEIRVWDLSETVTKARPPQVTVSALPGSPDEVQYTNAKVLLVGDTHAGKTALAQRLATDEWKPSEDSTVGAWSTQLSLKGNGDKLTGLEMN